MLDEKWNRIIRNFDTRRDVAVPGTQEETIRFCVEHFVASAKEAIASQGYFAVALSGGSTPLAIYAKFTKEMLDWSRVMLFWSDERCVSPTYSDSNYYMAMESGFGKLPIPKDHIFRMQADAEDLEGAAREYETLIQTKIPAKAFDYIMLGMGEDGHTASLFPLTHGLHAENRLVIANYIPTKDLWRMTLTFECINNARNTVIYVLGENKRTTLTHVLFSTYDPDHLPVQRVGTPEHKALWIMDSAAAPLAIHSENMRNSQR